VVDPYQVIQHFNQISVCFHIISFKTAFLQPYQVENYAKPDQKPGLKRFLQLPNRPYRCHRAPFCGFYTTAKRIICAKTADKRQKSPMNFIWHRFYNNSCELTVSYRTCLGFGELTEMK